MKDCRKCNDGITLGCNCSKNNKELEDVTNKEELNTPMGVSQWKEYGKKYGYWDFFIKKQKKEFLEIIKTGKSKCACGLDFKDGCLCLQERAGYNKLRQEMLDKLNH